MNLLIFECFSGGGYANEALSSSILSEAYGMLKSLISDCKAAGHNVITLMDSRLTAFNPPSEADRIITVHSRNETYEKLKDLSSLVDAVYIIAPESGQVLEKLLESLVDSSVISLNCEVDGIKKVSNKMTMYTILNRRGIKVPETILFDIQEKKKYIKCLVKELDYPLIFKPTDGVGCGGLSILENENEIVGAIKKVVQESFGRQFVAQKFIKGIPVSASVISTGREAVAITLNRQWITLASPNGGSTYYGGEVPFNHLLGKTALRIAEMAVEAIEGLHGYVGVDMIITEQEPVVIEINPRLTTSYIGLKRIAEFNTVDLITDAVIGRRISTNLQTKGYSFFSKVMVPSNPMIICETYKLKDVVSPPFPIEGKTVCALIASSSNSLNDAQSGFYRSKKRLLSLYGSD